MAAKKKTGIFAGDGGGLFSSGRKARLLEQAAEQHRKELIGGLDIGVDELVSGAGDPEYARAFQDQFKAFQDMARSTDKETQHEGITGIGQLAGAVRGAIDKRRTDQSTRVVDAAKDMREQAQKAVGPMRELQARTDELYSLLADKDFDVDNPLNRGKLISLLESNARQMLTDPDDLADALRGVNGGGLLGAVVQLGGGLLAAEDYKFTKEDFTRLADASYTFQQNKYENIMAPIARDAAALEKAGAGLDIFPQGYSLSRYILGDPEDFEKPIKTAYPEPIPKQPTIGSVASGVPGALDKMLGGTGAAGADPEEPPDRGDFFGTLGYVARDAIERTRFPDGRPDEQAARANPVEVYGAGPHNLRDLWAKMEKYPEGTSFKADPSSGRMFAFTPDGKRAEVETAGGFFGAGGERKKVRQFMSVNGGAGPARGRIKR